MKDEIGRDENHPGRDRHVENDVGVFYRGPHVLDRGGRVRLNDRVFRYFVKHVLRLKRVGSVAHDFPSGSGLRSQNGVHVTFHGLLDEFLSDLGESVGGLRHELLVICDVLGFLTRYFFVTNPGLVSSVVRGDAIISDLFRVGLFA